jgi:uncharacterized protein
MTLTDFFQRIGSITLKVTSGCNLHCAYCNVEALTARTPRMSLERFKQVAKMFLVNSRQPFLTLEFHGGEPLLLPDEWYEEAVAYAQALARQYNRTVQFPLMTNGTLLTEKRLLKLHNLGIVFGMSMDGPPDVNDRLRGGGHAVERAVRLFKKHRIDFGITTVLSRANCRRMDEVMTYFADVGVDNFRVNPLQPQGRGNNDAELLTGEEMFDSMLQVLDHMDRTRVQVEEMEIALVVHRFLRGRDAQPRLSCWEFECQAGRSYCAIDHKGAIHACGSDVTNHMLGHLDSGIEDSHHDATLGRLHHKGDWVLRCFDCSARRICHHSCPTSDFNSDQFKEYDCRYTKLLYAHLHAHPDKAQRIDAARRARHGPPPGSSFVPLSQVRMIRVG